MAEVEHELYKLGVPVKTRHNEVAPGQFEIAPLFETSQLASDHQMIMMEMLKRDRAHLRPAGAAARKAVRRHQRLRQAQQLVDGHRHGREPARPGKTPTPICSSWCSCARSFAPWTCTPICCAPRSPRPATITAWAPTKRRRRSSRSSWATCSPTSSSRSSRGAKPDQQGGTLDLGVDDAAAAPEGLRRPQPHLAFRLHGNKFEFRAVGRRASHRLAEHGLNTIVAESLDYLAGELERQAGPTPSPAKLQQAAVAVLKEVIKTHKRVIFNGDGYSADWHREAEHRGLPHLRDTVRGTAGSGNSKVRPCSKSTVC